MARRCSVCSHAERDAIDRSLVAGQSIAQISRHSALSKDALRRHRESHLPKALAEGHAATEATRAEGLAGKLDSLEAEAIKLGTKAVAKGDLRTGLVSIAERTRLLSLRVQAHVKGIPGAGVTPANRFKALPAPGHPALPLPVAGITVLPTPEARQRLREAVAKFVAWRQEVPEADRPAFGLKVLERCKAHLADLASQAGPGNGDHSEG